MAVDITIEEITDGTVVNGAWVGTGVFDKLLAAANANIELQYTNGRIKSTEYAAAYLGAMQTEMQLSISYPIQEKQAEAQIDELLANGIKDRELKEAQIASEYVKRIVSDKEATNLGLDDAIKVSEASRTGTTIYTPKYEKGVI